MLEIKDFIIRSEAREKAVQENHLGKRLFGTEELSLNRINSTVAYRASPDATINLLKKLFFLNLVQQCQIIFFIMNLDQ